MCTDLPKCRLWHPSLLVSYSLLQVGTWRFHFGRWKPLALFWDRLKTGFGIFKTGLRYHRSTDALEWFIVWLIGDRKPLVSNSDGGHASGLDRCRTDQRCPRSVSFCEKEAQKCEVGHRWKWWPLLICSLLVSASPGDLQIPDVSVCRGQGEEGIQLRWGLVPISPS